MARLSWREPSLTSYGAGVDRGVLYSPDDPSIVWNGLSKVESLTQASEEYGYFDGFRYRKARDSENYGADISCYTYPEELDDLNQEFGFTFRTQEHSPLGLTHKIHIVYNARFTPNNKDYETLGSGAGDFIFALTTRGLEVYPGVVSSHLIIDTKLAHPWIVEEFENIIYGQEDSNARLPSPEEIFDIFEDGSIVKITDLGDGTWRAEGPDEVITMLDSTSFQIEWPSAVYIDAVTYRIKSL